MACGRTTVGAAFAAGLLYSLSPMTASAQNSGQIDTVHQISNYKSVTQQMLESPAPEAIFGLHVTSILNTGVVGYRPGPAMASADNFYITVRGRQTHGERFSRWNDQSLGHPDRPRTASPQGA